MTPHSEVSSFDANIDLYDTTDPVLGGISGQSNDPIKALANRSRFLYNFHQGFTDVVAMAANTTVTTSAIGKLGYINATGNITITLAATSGFLVGQTLHFKCKNTLGKCAAIVPTGSDIITDGSLVKNIWLYDGEEISLIKIAANEWQIIFAKGNFDIVGNDGLVRKQSRNSIIAQGQIINRADYARLFQAVQADIISESTWLTDSFNYRGLFAAGDGATTFRVPDMRSMSWRALDLSRGVTYSRLGTTPGTYQADELLKHGHPVQYSRENGGAKDATGYIPVDSTNPIELHNANKNAPTTVTADLNSNAVGGSGGNETVTKNIGLTPVIYF